MVAVIGTGGFKVLMGSLQGLKELLIVNHLHLDAIAQGFQDSIYSINQRLPIPFSVQSTKKTPSSGHPDDTPALGGVPGVDWEIS